MKTILVTGANGQLGKCFQLLKNQYPEFLFIFKSKAALDLISTENIQQIIEKQSIDFCINCAAYTNVEAAEENREKAFAINAEAVKNLANVCHESGTVLVHYSTDYVFDGNQNRPYREEDIPNPINVYGASKLSGEQYIQQIANNYFIFRTSWLYSRYGHNFYKTITQKGQIANTTLNITGAQIGIPTSALDLAEATLQVLASKSTAYGLYHYANSGSATWYDFAEEILRLQNRISQVNLNKSDAYKTVAPRPAYSVLDTTKLRTTFRLKILHWKKALKKIEDKA